jgi:hypothetical protein
MITVTQLQQFIFCTAWMWPLGVVLSNAYSDSSNVGGGLLFGAAWLFCGIRLFAKGRWPFNKSAQ